ncbi:MAG: isoleucine--tRNA ligase [Elusimicrobiales bacterium]
MAIKETAGRSGTVLLPKTDFPMRAELPKREPLTIKLWNDIGLYRKMLEKRRGKTPYILHDGPPYANGHIHNGHALNKILKDITIKSRAMSGHYTPYVPGWDCHGLPIEHALLKELKQDKRHIEDIPAFRLKARQFAAKFIDLQREDFKRLGIPADWDNPYITMSPHFEGTVIKAFLDLARKGCIFKGKKPIYWCVSCETALADAEVEYKDKTSNSIFVKFELAEPFSGKKAALAIWTTTPWTLPANMAAAVDEEESYILLRDRKTGEHYIAAEKLADSFISECGLDCEKGEKIPGKALLGLKYRHPLFADKANPVIHTDFVAMDTGSGIVHVAPGHGEDDFYSGLEQGIEIFCPVDNRGRFTKEGREFEGLSVWEANPAVIEKLRAAGKLLAAKDISHSYPHCWRCKKPVIFRATEQWFLGVDKNGLRDKLVAAIDKVNWVPPGSRERIRSMVQQRPDWCLSRQRAWGTPVPMMNCSSCHQLQYDETLFAAIEKRAFAEGSDFWFSDPAEKIVPPGYKCKCGGTTFVKETDILDVWLDSGVSWAAVLPEGHYPADLYMEGSDQHRGWFQTSLIPSVALNGHAPYKAVYTHGFIMDEKGHAMHKSAGNAVSPQEIIGKYGAETLRLWVALSDCTEDVRLSEKLLEGPIDAYRKIRNTSRYLLGNLWDYDPQKHKVSYDKLHEADRYMLHRLAELVAAARGHYDRLNYRAAIRDIADFCILDLSSFYFDTLKDRLYTLGKNSWERRSAQTALYEIATGLFRLMAPVLSFTAEEAWQELRKANPGLEESVFLSDFPQAGEKCPQALAEKWEKIRQIRELALKALEEKRKAGIIGAPLEAKVIFRANDAAERAFISGTLELWPSVLIVSAAELAEGPEQLSVEVVHADGAKCPRCWQWKKDIGAHPAHPDVCARCAGVLEAEK